MKYFVIHTAISVCAGAALLVILAVIRPVTAATWQGIFAGFILAVLFVSTGFLSSVKGIKSGQKTFHRFLFGSIIVRLMFVAVALIVLISCTSVDQRALLISMFCWYLVLQIGEIVGFHKITIKEV